jgi:hypothetical protein
VDLQHEHEEPKREHDLRLLNYAERRLEHSVPVWVAIANSLFAT